MTSTHTGTPMAAGKQTSDRDRGAGAGARGAGSRRSRSAADTRPSGHTVVLKEVRFHPGSLTINRGDTVTWSWRDGGEKHNVTFHGFHSRTMGKGSYTVRFIEQGHLQLPLHDPRIGRDARQDRRPLRLRILQPAPQALGARRWAGQGWPCPAHALLDAERRQRVR